MSKFVLIVDDEREIRLILKNFLASNYPHCRAVEAVDGMEALRKIANQKFELIICDLKMPKADGMEVIKSLTTKNKENKPEHVMVLSGSITKDQAEKLNKTSPVYFMGKPFDEDELKLYLDKCLK